jgi:ribosomal protein L34E
LDDSFALALLGGFFSSLTCGVIDKRAVSTMRADERAKLPKLGKKRPKRVFGQIILDTCNKQRQDIGVRRREDILL